MITPEQIIAAIFYSHISMFGLAGDLDMKETVCLANNIYFEAKGQPSIGQSAVAHVTLNRVERKDYPNTICKVVFQKRCAEKAKDRRKYAHNGCTAQFTWTWDGKPDKIYLYNKHGKFNKKVYDAYYIAAYEAVLAVLGLSDDPTMGASHYYNPDVCYRSSIKKDGGCHPRWAFYEGFEETVELYDHQFILKVNEVAGNH